MIQIMRLVTQKHLLMSLKTDSQKKKNQKKKNQKKNQKKKKKELEAKINKPEHKNNNTTTNQITK